MLNHLKNSNDYFKIDSSHLNHILKKVQQQLK